MCFLNIFYIEEGYLFSEMDWKEMIFFLGMLCLFRPKLTSCCKCPGPEHPQWLYCKSDIGKTIEDTMCANQNCFFYMYIIKAS